MAVIHEDVCPCCGAIWGFDEWEDQGCYACGWPVEDCPIDDDTQEPDEYFETDYFEDDGGK